MNKDIVQNLTSPRIGTVKRLGMKRSTNMLSDKAKSMTPVVSESARSMRRTTHGTPRTDAEMNCNTPYGESAQHHSTERRTASANCPPFARQFNKKLGAKMSKKKLQFHSANEVENLEDKSTDVEVNTEEQIASEENEDYVEDECVESLSNSSLISRIRDMEKELEARQRHVERVSKLKKDIEVWKTGFSTALDDLRKQMKPIMDVETTLQNLKIDLQMSKYLDD